MRRCRNGESVMLLGSVWFISCLIVAIVHLDNAATVYVRWVKTYQYYIRSHRQSDRSLSTPNDKNFAASRDRGAIIISATLAVTSGQMQLNRELKTSSSTVSQRSNATAFAKNNLVLASSASRTETSQSNAMFISTTTVRAHISLADSMIIKKGYFYKVVLASEKISNQTTRSFATDTATRSDAIAFQKMHVQINGGPLFRSNASKKSVTSGNAALILFLKSHYNNERTILGSDMTNPFVNQRCAYSNCIVTSNAKLADSARLIVVTGPFDQGCYRKSNNTGIVTYYDNGRSYPLPSNVPNAAFVYYQHEAAARTRPSCLAAINTLFNYTWTYRLDSDVRRSYGYTFKLAHLTAAGLNSSNELPTKNVLWYVSNCGGVSNAKARFHYAVELSKYIDVDIFGQCSNRSDGCAHSDHSCELAVRKQYRFYLSFENSLCTDYITEKFFTALEYGNVPIVMGYSKAEYENIGPPNSFIYANDFVSPEALALYLQNVASSPELFNKFHAWKHKYHVSSTYLPAFPNACKLCELATLQPRKSINITQWWNDGTQCRTPSWSP